MVYTLLSSLQNAVCFIILTYLVPVLFTFYIQGVLKLKNNSGAKRLNRPIFNHVTFLRNYKEKQFLGARHFDRRCVCNPNVY